MSIIIGADISMRSSALVAIDSTGQVIDFKIISSDNSEYNDEKLLLFNSSEVLNFMDRFCKDTFSVKIEYLSLKSTAGLMDRIIGNHWNIRTSIFQKYGILPSTVSPQAWKKNVYTRDDLDIILLARKNKTSKAKLKKLQKELCLQKLDKPLVDMYYEYIRLNKLPKGAIYDLSDATHIARYGLANGE